MGGRIFSIQNQYSYIAFLRDQLGIYSNPAEHAKYLERSVVSPCHRYDFLALKVGARYVSAVCDSGALKGCFSCIPLAQIHCWHNATSNQYIAMGIGLLGQNTAH
jgi:hypothetical protein